MLGARVDTWAALARDERVAGHRLSVWSRDGEGPTLLFLHGFPSSSYDWRQVLDLVGPRATLSFDFLGFGLSDKPPGHIYSLAWQADAAEELVRRAGNPEVFIVAHDMGTSVATELLARDLQDESRLQIAGALLLNAGMILDLASLTIGQRLLRSPGGGLFARLTTRRGFAWQFGALFSAAHPLDDREATDQWALLSHLGGHRIAHRLVHYMDERERLTDRWHGAFRDWDGNLSLLWGLEDPVATTAVLKGLRALRPGVKVTELAEVGHYPQIERPDLVAAAIGRADGQARDGVSGVPPRELTDGDGRS